MKRYFITTALCICIVALSLFAFSNSDALNRFFSKIVYLAGRQIATVGGVFNDTFSGTSSLQEAGAMSDSLSPSWWVNSGAYFNIKNGISETVQGDLPAGDYWGKLYKASNPTDTDGGIHPQNIFRLVTKNEWKNYEQEMYYKIVKDQLSTSSNRNVSNGLLLFNRYQNGQNLYYTGVRVDGYLVIKKKQASTYYTMAYTKIFPGKYDAVQSPNLLPKNTWIGLKSRVVDQPDGSVLITLYTDIGKTGAWTQVAQVTDNGMVYGNGVVTGPASAGIRTDFMDVQFSDYKISEIDLNPPPPVVVPPVATSTPPVTTTTPPVVVPPVATTTPPVVVPPVATTTPPVIPPVATTTTSTTTPPDTTGGGSGGGGTTTPPPTPVPDPTPTPPPPPPDTVAPVITVLGANPARLLKGVVYLDLGATVTDNIDTNLGVVATGDQIDTKKVGTYTVTYTAHDNAGNYATATRAVIISAPKPPVVIPPPQATTTPPIATSTPPVATTTPPVVVPPIVTTTPPIIVISIPTSTPVVTSTPPVIVVDAPVLAVDTPIPPVVFSGSGSSGGGRGGGGGGGILVPLIPIVPLPATVVDTTDDIASIADAFKNDSVIDTTPAKTDDTNQATSAVVGSAGVSDAGEVAPPTIETDIWLGVRSDDVKDVQTILAEDSELYPEGLVTGFYGQKTMRAVIAFQKKYGIVSSGNAGSTGLGIVGPKTRMKMNELFIERKQKIAEETTSGEVAKENISSGASQSEVVAETSNSKSEQSGGAGAPMSPAEKAQVVLVIQTTLASVARQIKGIIEQVISLKVLGF